jgi:hypothetical protein
MAGDSVPTLPRADDRRNPNGDLLVYLERLAHFVGVKLRKARIYRCIAANWGGNGGAARYGVEDCHSDRVIGEWLGSNGDLANCIDAAASRCFWPS